MPLSFIRHAATAALLAAITFAPASQAKSSAKSQPMMFIPITWSVLAEPVYSVEGTDGVYHLSYEVQLSNTFGGAFVIDSLEVLDARTRQPTGNNRVLAQDGPEVTGKLVRLAQPVNANGDEFSDIFTNRLPLGETGIMYFDLTYPTRKAIPKRLMHRFTGHFEDGSQAGQSFTAEDGGIAVSGQPAIRVHPPLEGKGWIDANGAGPIISYHRDDTAPTNGVLHPMERYAIDFMKLNDQGMGTSGDPNLVESYYGYGQRVLSATPGRVVSVLNDQLDQTPNDLKPPKQLEDYSGNHVIVAIGGGKYAAYAHLKPGSVAVHKGQRVRTGQLLGLLGNSGNTDAPHLHFQIMDTPDFFNTTSLPFVFDRMIYQGHVPGSFDSGNNAVSTGTAEIIDTTGAGRRINQMPLSMDVVEFP